MNQETIRAILEKTAHPRVGGSQAEQACAAYLRSFFKEAKTETFPLPVYTAQTSLWVGGKEIPCRGYHNTGSGDVTAPLCYLPIPNDIGLSACCGKIVLTDGPLSAKTYRKLVEHGALGVLSPNGDVRDPDKAIDQKEVRELTAEEPRIPGVLIHISDALALAESGGEITISQRETRAEGYSENVVLDLHGEQDEWIVVSAHYDSTALSCGSYDNMSGAIALLYLAEHFSAHPHRYGLRLIWTGAEERGLLGAKAYCAAHEDKKDRWLVNVNLDMLGTPMGRFVGFSCANEETRQYLQDFAASRNLSMETRLDIRSSDSNCFADLGVPTVSFARYAPSGTAPVHTAWDTPAAVSPARLSEDCAVVAAFVESLIDADPFPLPRYLDEKISAALDRYFKRN